MVQVSIILPAHNEAESLKRLLPQLTGLYPDFEIIVVNDGSNDDTKEVVENSVARLISHPYCMGNGAAVKTGARAASGEVLVYMDADGQHSPEDVARLITEMDKGFDMVVGARAHRHQASFSRSMVNKLYNWFASIMTGFRILDLTSGLRAVNARKFRKFLYLLPNGFSYPTTITMAFFRSGFPVSYLAVEVKKRHGTSKIRLLKDGVRFFLIILKIGSLFSPMRLFLPISLALFSTGTAYYGYTYYYYSRFTNMSALLFISSLMIFLIGIVSEQVSSLHYRHSEQFEEPEEEPGNK